MKNVPQFADGEDPATANTIRDDADEGTITETIAVVRRHYNVIMHIGEQLFPEHHQPIPRQIHRSSHRHLPRRLTNNTLTPTKTIPIPKIQRTICRKMSPPMMMMPVKE
ncbi:hypothetical protein Droror1_Dr00014619 [Drosera rotundifolia]